MEILIVVDMQNDFVDGALGTAEAVAIVPNVVQRVTEGLDRGETVFFTRDTHETEYMDSQEGHNLPVPHCIRDTPGWEIIPQLKPYITGFAPVDKPTFGSINLAQTLSVIHQGTPIQKITLIGLCTDICVISNALLLKAFLPEVPIAVDAACCAGVTPESHLNALASMKMCQIAVENEA